MTTRNAATVNADLAAKLRASKTLILIRTDDEVRVMRALVGCAAAAKFPEMLSWSCSPVGGGFISQLDPANNPIGRVIEPIQDPSGALSFIANRPQRTLFVMQDLHAWFDPAVKRALRTLAQQLQAKAPGEKRSIILLAPMTAEIPRDIPELITIDYPLPDRAEVSEILDDVIKALPTELRDTAAPNGTRDRAIDGALGLSALQISDSYSQSLVTTRKVDPLLVAGQKKQLISGIPGATWYEPDARGLDAMGGNGDLKAWCLKRRPAFSPKAKAFGLPAPKGIMLVGPPGTGKSLTAKCVATAFGMPLIRADFAGTMSKYVGDSETNFARLLALAETVAPCVFWVDEIEKALSGSTGEQGDGGVSSRALGALLSWMQEKTAPVFVIATANDVRALPPELLRKGRFDELFFVDLPNTAERAEILAASLTAHARPTDGIDLAEVARATAGFVGAEIAALVPEALFVAFADGERAVTTGDLITAASAIVPLSKTAGEKIEALRTWAKGRARPASAPETTTNSNTRALDL